MTVATIHHGELPIITSGPRRSLGGRGMLDSVSYDLLTSADQWQVDALALGFAMERPVSGFHSMWVQSLTSEDENDQVAAVRVECVGLISAGEKRKRRMSVAGREIPVGPDEVVVLAWFDGEEGEEVDGEPLDKVKRRTPKLDSAGDVIYKTITTPLGTGPRWNVREAIVVVTDTYFSTSAPDMTKAGTVMAPPSPPSPPPYVWGGYTEPMRKNFPEGWVLDDRQTEELFTGLWEITDTHGFYYSAVPD